MTILKLSNEMKTVPMKPKYNSLREKIRAEKIERAERYAKFKIIWERAVEVGHKAAIEACPMPMVVKNVQTNEQWHVSEGACGFARVHLVKGNTSFAHWAKKNAGFTKHYYGGLSLSVSAYNQSVERKTAFADAVCEVLKSEGIDCYASSRLD